jgi:hypothetical protein
MICFRNISVNALHEEEEEEEDDDDDILLGAVLRL